MRLKLRITIISAFVLLLMPVSGMTQGAANSPAAKTPVAYSSDQRFADYGDGTILDTKTNLMWMKKDYWQVEGKWLNWYMAVEYIQKMNHKKVSGYSDWRFPTPEEAKSLYERHKINEDKDGDKIFMDPFFPKGAGWATWTGEEKSDKAIVFSYKDEGGQNYQDKISGGDAFVRPVRKP